jgi:hypothetical protein
MTNTEATVALLCPQSPDAEVHVLAPRLVPLGGPRAMTVRRTLPHRMRSFVGAWCFVDHYGPDDVGTSGGMDVPPHPHTGLQTLSWLFSGEVEHRDSAGVHAVVRPGEVNLMTAGHGIAHSEVSTRSTSVLHGVQLWVVLPQADRGAARDFQHHRPPLVEVAPGVRARVLVGALAGEASPVRTATPLLGAELHLAAGARCTIPVDPGHEHGLLIDRGTARLCGTPLGSGELGVVDAGRHGLALATDEPTRGLLLGGAPFGEEVVMWWNFIGATHEDIEQARADWQDGSDRFGAVLGYRGEVPRLTAPPLPRVRLRPRGPRRAPGSGG